MPDITVPLESWKPIEGYEALYEISDLGRVRSLRRNIIMRPGYSGRGYPAVVLCVDKRPSRRYVHHLVAAAFIGPRPDGMHICHGNGDFTDNRAVNLRYDTPNANMRDAIEHGSHHSVGRTVCAQGHELTPENTLIRARISSDGFVKTARPCRECARLNAERQNQRVRDLKRTAHLNS